MLWHASTSNTGQDITASETARKKTKLDLHYPNGVLVATTVPNGVLVATTAKLFIKKKLKKIFFAR